MVLRRPSVQLRVYLAFGALMMLMVCLLALAILGLHSSQSGLTSYRETSAQATTLSQRLDLLSQARLAFANYDAQRSLEKRSRLESALETITTSDTANQEYVATVQGLIDLDGDLASELEIMDASGIAATQTLSALIEQTSQSANLNAKAAALSGLAMQRILSTRLLVGTLLSEPTEENNARVMATASGASTALDDLRSTFFKADDTARVDAVKDAMAVYQQKIGVAFSLLQERGALSTQFTDLDQQIADARNEEVTTILVGQDSAGQAAIEQASTTLISVLTLGAIALFLGGAIAFLMARWLSESISKMAKDMEELAQGKLHRKLVSESSAPEFSQMYRALLTFRDNGLAMEQLDAAALEKRKLDAEAQGARDRLQAAIATVVTAAAAGDLSKRIEGTFNDAELQSAAEGVNALLTTVESGIAEAGGVLAALAHMDLTKRMNGNYQGSFAKLQADTNALAENLTGIMQQLRETSESLKAATTELLAGAGDLSERTTTQAATVEATSSAMKRLADTVSFNAERAKEGSDVASGVTLTAQDGGLVMDRATDAMERITSSSSRIADVIGLIDNIAFQTNLLALNASVEAARAGDAGKGFGVVAVEVRRLAQSAAQASGEIKVLVEQSVKEVESGTQLVGAAAEALEKIRMAAQENNEITNSIAQASEEQAHAIVQISTSVRRIEEVTQHNAALVEETNAAIEQSEGQARSLDLLVDGFVLPLKEDYRATAPSANRHPNRHIPTRTVAA